MDRRGAVGLQGRLLLLALGSALLMSCAGPVADDDDSVLLDDDDSAGVMPEPSWTYLNGLLGGSCDPCHTGSSTSGMGGLGDYDAGYAAIVGQAAQEQPAMSRVEPGDAEASYLMHKVDGTQLSVGGSGDRMPASGPPFLSQLQRNALRQWIDAGAAKD